MRNLAAEGWGGSFDLSSLDPKDMVSVIKGRTVKVATKYNMVKVSLTDKGKLHVVRSSDVKEFLRNATPEDFLVEPD